ncbi:type II toxin-antitoxin system VapC family toxin [Aquipuribacter nitratireducens]|uniref:Type II toxin-antitoxin system VapC family toxin n=1 Tax=Aquipuribacter nitratireducens TaxID=650104 RepID=A0ABW0GQD2_9MICO
MNLLLDTHVLLWALADDDRLSAGERSALTSAANRLVVSAASTWEIGIKRALGRLDAPDDLREQIVALRADELPMSVEHTLAAAALPRHHADPFDRMLVAQARAEDLTLVTHDAAIARYDVAVLRA